MAVQATTRGIRLNNPGNIRKSDATRELIGLSVFQDDPGFWTFFTPEYGIRAIAKLLLTYQRKHRLFSCAQIIGRWAPSSDSNPTTAYAEFVATQLNVNTNEDVDLEDTATLTKMVKAIIHFENGRQPYDTETIARGIRLATGNIGVIG